ncbi:MAG TPA: hypothetical protein DCZ75_16020 [Geobacter sp.]|nr:hypothetical protein [Geobacter sp.]
MKRLLAAAVLSACSALPAAAQALDQLTPYFSARYFTWQEHDGGRRILKERGPLFSTGVLLGIVTKSSITLSGKGELFGGEVDYDGETQAPHSVPVRTQVGYFGTTAQLDLGYRAETATLRGEPFVGIGHRWWLRDLQDTTSASGEPVSGYTESWQTLYGRFGARGRLILPRGVEVVAEGGAKYPFYTGNSVDFSSSGVTTFRPRPHWSAFAETGVTYRKARITLSYEGFRFNQSHERLVQGKNYFQPKSSSDIFGLNLGWTFR